jgi:hypothetical protein
LGSDLKDHSPQDIYVVPAGYFEGLADQIMNRIKALNSSSSKDELNYLSPLLSNISKVTPYSVPAGFFQSLSEGVLNRIHQQEDHQTSEAEIRSLSPLLSSLKNKNPYSVPAGYFETIETKGEKKEAKVVSITRRRWYRLAAAAVVIGIVVISGLLIVKQGQVNPVDNPHAWIEKNVKKVDKAKIDELVSLTTNGDMNDKSNSENEAAQKAEIKELMKDVPEKEIEEFLNDAVALESSAEADGIMNE